MAKLTRLEIARATYRLAREELITLDVASELLNVSPRAVERWGIQGKSGRHLDVFFDPDKNCWMTSKAAIARFTAPAENGVGATG